MTKRKKAWLIGGTVAVAGLVVGHLYWMTFVGYDPWPIIRGSATLDGKARPVTLAKSSRGEIAMLVGGDEGIYVFSPKQGVGTPNNHDFQTMFGYVWPKPGRAYLGVLLTPQGKATHDPKLVHKPGYLAFTTLNHHRLEVKY